MVSSGIILKMRRHKRGSGTKHTGRVSHRRRHHENKRVRVEERAMEQVRQTKCVAVAEKPMPLIDIGIDRIDELIRSVINAQFEDSIQDAWVRVLEEPLATEEDILRIARGVSRRDACQTISERYKLVSGDAPINLRSGETHTASRFDMMGEEDEGLKFIHNDYKPEKFGVRVFKKPNFLTRFLRKLKNQEDKGHMGECKICRQHLLLDERSVCVQCRDFLLEKHRNPLWPFITMLQVRNDNGYYGVCIRCNNKALLDKQKICLECSDYIIDNGLNPTTALIPCLVCGHTIYVSRWEVKKNPHIYCSYKCACRAQSLRLKGFIRLRNDKHMCEVRSAQ